MSIPHPSAPKPSGIDGNVIPASKRPDGSVRKEIKVRPGFTPQEDVARYRSPRVARKLGHDAPPTTGGDSGITGLADLLRTLRVDDMAPSAAPKAPTVKAPPPRAAASAAPKPSAAASKAPPVKAASPPSVKTPLPTAGADAPSAPKPPAATSPPPAAPRAPETPAVVAPAPARKTSWGVHLRTTSWADEVDELSDPEFDDPPPAPQAPPPPPPPPPAKANKGRGPRGRGGQSAKQRG